MINNILNIIFNKIIKEKIDYGFIKIKLFYHEGKLVKHEYVRSNLTLIQNNDNIEKK